jgi:hypothetical protein
MGKDADERRLENDKANKEALADAVRESDPKEAERNDNAAKGLDAEIRHGRGEELGEDRS